MATEKRWRGPTLATALVILLSACVPALGGGDPVAAARTAVEGWARTTGVSSRNVTYSRIGGDDNRATVEVVAEHQYYAGGPWLEERALVDVSKSGGDWIVDTGIGFGPTEWTLATAATERDATATVEAAAAQATAAAEAMIRDAIATAEAQSAAATQSAVAVTKTAEAVARDATATAQAEARATEQAEQADRQATASAEKQQRIAAANAEFDDSDLPPGWRVVRPDPSKWSVEQGVLRFFPSTEIDDCQYTNEFVRPLPSLDEDLDIIVRLWAYPTKIDGQFFGISLRTGEDLGRESVYLGVGLSEDGPYVSGGDAGYYCRREGRSINFPLDEAIFLKIERRQGVNLTMYVSSDGSSWTYVNETNDVPAYDTFGIYGEVARNVTFYADVDFIHFQGVD